MRHHLRLSEMAAREGGRSGRMPGQAGGQQTGSNTCTLSQGAGLRQRGPLVSLSWQG